ncbi:IS5/IS1182 family transposase, partial [Streptomyces vietnamensis]
VSPPVRRATRRPSRPSWPASVKQRNAVERCTYRLKQWRGPAMRTDKLATAYQAAPHLTALLTWARR